MGSDRWNEFSIGAPRSRQQNARLRDSRTDVKERNVDRENGRNSFSLMIPLFSPLFYPSGRDFLRRSSSSSSGNCCCCSCEFQFSFEYVTLKLGTNRCERQDINAVTEREVAVGLKRTSRGSLSLTTSNGYWPPLARRQLSLIPLLSVE